MKGKDGIDVRKKPDRRTAARLALALGSTVLLTTGPVACGGIPPTGARSSTPSPPMVAQGSPGRPAMAVTPGPQAPFVPVVVTASGVDPNGAPVNPTADFAVGMPVYVSCRVQGVRPGEVHRLTVRWYINGQLARWPGSYTYATVAQDGLLSFSLTYATAGEGVVKLYWDEPVGDSNEQPNGRFLAQAISFTVR